MKLNYSEYSDIGGRNINEDMAQITSYPEAIIAMVADGLGGHGYGDVASRMAVSAISENIQNCAVSECIAKDAILKANERLLQKQQENKADMKTTIAMVWLNEHKACISHMGDTRIYQFRKGEIVYQSLDHSVPQMEVSLGDLEPTEIRGHIDRNRLTRALGSKQNVAVDTRLLSVESGDAFLLCSDGFWELIWENEMIHTLQKSIDAQSWLREMIKLLSVRLTSNSDNNTAITIWVG